MITKFIVRTTEEFTYDKEGRVIKKITTEESYEEEVVPKSFITTEDIIKKAVGVPNTGTITNPPWTTTISYDSAKADTSGITHNNITINASEKILSPEEVAETVKKAIKKSNLRPFSD